MQEARLRDTVPVGAARVAAPIVGTIALQAAGRSLTGTPRTTLGMPFWFTTMSGTARTWPDLSSRPVPSTQEPEAGRQSLITLVYVVTDVAEDKVVLDGNHPLAGMALRFALTVKDVRPATEDEIEHEHAHVHDDGHHDHQRDGREQVQMIGNGQRGPDQHPHYGHDADRTQPRPDPVRPAADQDPAYRAEGL